MGRHNTDVGLLFAGTIKFGFRIQSAASAMPSLPAATARVAASGLRSSVTGTAAARPSNRMPISNLSATAVPRLGAGWSILLTIRPADDVTSGLFPVPDGR
jgi:hypothetical protein